MKARKLNRKEINETYEMISTKLSQALLEMEALILTTAIEKKGQNHYIDHELANQLCDILDKVEQRRVAFERGLEGEDADKIIFLDHHPSFIVRKMLDKLK